MALLTFNLGATGKAATAGYTQYDTTGAQTVARTTTGVTEFGTTGVYYVSVTLNASTTLVVWNDTDTGLAGVDDLKPILPNAQPGAADGILIAGSNASTTFANLTVTSVFSVGSNFTVGGTFSVTGAVEFDSTFVVVGAVELQDNLTIAGDTVFTGTMLFGGNMTILGAFSAATNSLPWNAAWDAEVQSEVADALVAYDPPTHAELTSAVSGLSTLTQADIRTATGMASADLDTQLDAILAAAGGGDGSGANVVTITVNDGTDPIEAASVRMTQGVSTYTNTTNASGVTTFSLDNGTYTISISKGGYTFTPASQVVSGATSATKSMTAIVTASPSSPELCVVSGRLLDSDGTALVGEVLTFKLFSSDNTTTSGTVVSRGPISASPTDSSGDFSIELVRTDEFTSGATWGVTSPSLSWNNRRITLDSGTFDISSL